MLLSLCVLSLLYLAGSAEPLPQDWNIVGEGAWRQLPGKVVQNDGALATSIVLGVPGGEARAVRCTVEAGPESVAGGLWFNASEDLGEGRLLSLNAVAGGVVLRDAGGAVLWEEAALPVQHYTPYVLEGIVDGSRLRVQVLSWSGAILAQSPWLPEGLSGRFFGFHSEGGVCRFYRWAFAEAPLAPLKGGRPAQRHAAEPEQGTVEQQPGEDAGIGVGWRKFNGAWDWVHADEQAVIQHARAEEASLIHLESTGSRAIYRCTVAGNRNTAAVALLFQVSPDLTEGFECRLGSGLILRELGGRTLFKDPAFNLEPDTAYVLEGIVRTDRVHIRVLNQSGEVLLETNPAYVSDTNNLRQGVIGFRTSGSGAVFSDWSVQATEG